MCTKYGWAFKLQCKVEGNASCRHMQKVMPYVLLHVILNVHMQVMPYVLLHVMLFELMQAHLYHA
jgi:hypothetical protein